MKYMKLALRSELDAEDRSQAAQRAIIHVYDLETQSVMCGQVDMKDMIEAGSDRVVSCPGCLSAVRRAADTPAHDTSLQHQAAAVLRHVTSPANDDTERRCRPRFIEADKPAVLFNGEDDMKNYMNVRASAVAHADLTSGRAPTIHAFKAGSTVTACGALSGHEVEAAHDKPVSCDACMKALMNQQRASDHRVAASLPPDYKGMASIHPVAFHSGGVIPAGDEHLANLPLPGERIIKNVGQSAVTAMLDSGDAELLDKLRRMCGYVEDGSSESVTIAQDDATSEWTLYVGDSYARSTGKDRRYHSTSFHQVIRVAAEKELAGLCDDEGCPHHGTTHVCINGDDISAALAAFTTPTNHTENSMTINTDTSLMIDQYRTELEGLVHLAQEHLAQIAAGTFNPTEAIPISALGMPTHIAGNTLMRACYEAANKSGWWIDTETGDDVRTWPDKFFKLWVAAKLALVHSEVSEGLEGHRKGLKDDKLKHRDMLEVELADAVIRICDLAGGLGMDLGGAIAEKLEFNANRADHKIENRVAAGGKSI